MSFQKKSTIPSQRKFFPSGGVRGQQFVPDNNKCIRTSKGVGALTSNFLCRARVMDIFWNDSIP